MPKDKLHELNLSPAKSDDDICDNFLDSENKARAQYYTVHKMTTWGQLVRLYDGNSEGLHVFFT